MGWFKRGLTLGLLGCLTAGANVGAAETAGGNLLFNPGFEEELAANQGWRPWGTTDLGESDLKKVAVRDETVTHGGKYSLKLTDEWSDKRPYAVQFVTRQPDKTYRLSFWVKGQAQAKILCGAQFLQGETWLSSQTRQYDLTGEWQEIHLTIDKLPAAADRISIMISPTDGQKETQGTIWIDDASLLAE